ncbi:MAG: HipA domain-containing protein [Sphaerochaeta sp.]|nr:HipA domain-containing protein [Sphaerochaeta sp.]
MDYSHYPKNQKYYSGSEEKIGITIGSTDYILKFQKPSETGLLNNTICEYIGCHVFQMLGMNVQKTFLGTYEGRNVVALQDFIMVGQQFVPFNEVGDSSLEHDRETYQYSYADVMRMLQENTKLTKIPETINQFWRIYIIDALLGNFDRHGANWGFIKESNRYTLAPVFDNGSCLFPRIHTDEACLDILRDEHEVSKRVFHFPTSQIKLDNVKSSYFEVIHSLQFPECNAALLDIVGKMDMQRIAIFIDSIEQISEIQKRFYRTILQVRFEKILEASYKKLQGESVCE